MWMHCPAHGVGATLCYPPVGGAQSPLCQQRQALSLQCNDFSCTPLLAVCAPCSTLLLHLPTRHEWLPSLHLCTVQERTLTLVPPSAVWVCCCSPGAAHLPHPCTALPGAEMGCRSCSTLPALPKVSISMAQLLARAALGVFACLGGSTGSAGCEGAPLSWESWSSQGRLYWKQSWRKRSQADSKTITWLSSFCVIVKSRRSNSRGQTLKTMTLTQPWDFKKALSVFLFSSCACSEEVFKVFTVATSQDLAVKFRLYLNCTSLMRQFSKVKSQAPRIGDEGRSRGFWMLLQLVL